MSKYNDNTFTEKSRPKKNRVMKNMAESVYLGLAPRVQPKGASVVCLAGRDLPKHDNLYSDILGSHGVLHTVELDVDNFARLHKQYKKHYQDNRQITPPHIGEFCQRVVELNETRKLTGSALFLNFDSCSTLATIYDKFGDGFRAMSKSCTRQTDVWLSITYASSRAKGGSEGEDRAFLHELMKKWTHNRMGWLIDSCSPVMQYADRRAMRTVLWGFCK